MNEILELEEQGVGVELFALRRGTERIRHARGRELVARTQCVRPFSREALRAQFGFAVRAPRALLASWTRAVLSSFRSPALLARSLVVAAVAPALAERMRAAGTEHIHAHWATHPTLAASIVHRLTGIPFSFTTHADDLFAHHSGLSEKIRMARFVVTISEYNRRYLIERHGEQIATKLHVVHCGVESAQLESSGLESVELESFGLELRPDRGAADAPFEIVCVARFEAKKGHAALIDACALLKRRGVSFRCRLVGAGDLRESVAAQIDRLQLGDSVEMLGPRPLEEVVAILRSAQAMILPSIITPEGRRDGIPVALMEAMALEVPVVASAVSGIPELVRHHETGLLVEPGNAVQLADAVEWLRENPLRTRELAVAGRLLVTREFDLRSNVGTLRSLFAARAGASPATLASPRAARATPFARAAHTPEMGRAQRAQRVQRVEGA